MDKLEKKNSRLEKKNVVDINQVKKIESEKVIKEDRNKIALLAEKILLQPIKNGLESLKNLVLPEKIKKEVNEKISSLEKEKRQEKTDMLHISKDSLYELQQRIVIPTYYFEHEKKGDVQKAQIESVHSIIKNVSVGLDDSNPIARGAAQLLTRMNRYT